MPKFPPTIAKFDIFDKFRDIITWGSLDGFVVGGDAGYSVVPMGIMVGLETHTDINDSAYLLSDGYWVDLVQTGKVVTIEMVVNWLDWITNQDIMLALTERLFGIPYLGWRISGADLYAINHDGLLETSTDTGIDMINGNQHTRLKMVFTPGQDIKFYVNDVLKATHSTNLPNIVICGLYFTVTTLTNEFRDIGIGRVLIEREY